MRTGNDGEGNMMGDGFGDTTGNERDGVGTGIGYIVLSIRAICLTPCIIGSPILIPGGGAVV